MTRLVIVIVAGMTLMSSGAVHAGKIFGDVKLGDKPVPEGIKITITAPAPAGEAAAVTAKPAIADSAVTDKFGAYTLKVKGEGKCTLTLYWEKQTPSLEVFSYNAATRYDLILEKKDGAYILKRK